MHFPTPDAPDEQRHDPGDDRWWSESWYFDFAARDGSTGGYVRLGLYPNQRVAWYWACFIGEDRPTVVVVDHELAVPAPGSLQVRGEGLWADHNCEEPLERWSLGLEAFALSVDDPTELYADEPRGDRVPFGFELEWESVGTPFLYLVSPRYEIPCRVHGEVVVGDERIEIDAEGQRDHSWAPRDWWIYSWVWSAFHGADGTQLFGNAVRISDDFTFMTGYTQGGPAHPEPTVCERFEPVFEPTPDHLVDGVGWTLDDHRARVEPVAWAPLLLRDGARRSRFPRALCRATLEDGREAVGWMEFNQPE